MFRSGLGLLIIVGCLLYYTGAWSVVKEKLAAGASAAESGCYTELSRISADIASPVCGSIASGVRFVGTIAQNAGSYLSQAHDAIVGSIESLSGGGHVEMPTIDNSALNPSEALQSLRNSTGTISGTALQPDQVMQQMQGAKVEVQQQVNQAITSLKTQKK